MKNRLFDIWLSLRLRPGATELQYLLEQFATPYDIFSAEEREIEALSIRPALKRALMDKSLAESERIMSYCAANGIGIVFWQDEEYPASLRPLRDPPTLLYYKGRLPNYNRRLCISVVGTRTMSEYGKRMAYKIGYELASAGVVVVSGMALGNDSVAAAGAIMAGGSTVAVLGSGIDVIYPREHIHFYEEVTRHGAVISEYPPGTPAKGSHFPVRNRIISGLSQGTVVVEGSLRSGALITAKTAILQGRDIYAFPGNVGETNSAGTNQLISEGVAVILGARDVLENYTFLYRDVLDLNRFATAEKRSDTDDAALLRLGVYTRTYLPTVEEIRAKGSTGDHSAPTPSPRAPREQSKSARKERSINAPDQAADITEKKTTRSATPKTTKPKAERSQQAQEMPTMQSPIGDASRRALESLTETQRRIFEALPLEGAVTTDSLVREGFSASDIMVAVTILEIKGLVLTLPGGLIGRK